MPETDRIEEAVSLRVSVRDLVATALRGGDLVMEYQGPGRRIQGAIGHRQLQKDRPEGYRAEVPLSVELERDGLRLTVQGRADGLFPDEGPPMVEEIKTTTRSPHTLGENERPEHWAQAKIYAYIYARENALPEMAVRLTYYRMETGELREFTKYFVMDELAAFFDLLASRYIARTQNLIDWQKRRDDSIRDAEFPHPAYRKGQREFAVAVYRTLEAGTTLTVQAPTGVGKTVAALFPAMKALGLGVVEKIFFLSAKTSGKRAAEDACARLARSGMRMKTLTLTAKERVCPHPEAACHPDECPRARGHFDRVDAAIERMFEEDAWTRERVERMAEEFQVCPFEFSLDLSLSADLVIADYNYVFDPRVYLRRFFEEEKGAYAFLVDEAHNLVDRARGMYSAELRKQDVLDLKRLVKPVWPDGAKRLEALNRELLQLRKYAETKEKHRYSDLTRPEALFAPLRRFTDAAETWLGANRSHEHRQAVLDFTFQALRFQRAAEDYDERFVTLYRAFRNDLYVKMACLDPSFLLSRRLKQGKATVFFSATLTPLPYFRRVLGGDESESCLSLPSPFPEKNFGIFVHDGVETTWKRREAHFDNVAESLAAAVSPKRGNYIAYFPSYAYLEAVRERFENRFPDTRLKIQSPGMGEGERDAFLSEFREDVAETLLGFAVMGGVFGEGVDLCGERLSGVIVVGVGLPQVNMEQEEIRRHFDDTESMGFEYAYRYPGMNRVLQSAGRVIRSESDRGFVLLLDRRFTSPGTRTLFPAHWRKVAVLHTASVVSETVRKFWEDQEA